MASSKMTLLFFTPSFEIIIEIQEFLIFQYRLNENFALTLCKTHFLLQISPSQNWLLIYLYLSYNIPTNNWYLFPLIISHMCIIHSDSHLFYSYPSAPLLLYESLFYIHWVLFNSLWNFTRGICVTLRLEPSEPDGFTSGYTTGYYAYPPLSICWLPTDSSKFKEPPESLLPS